MKVIELIEKTVKVDNSDNAGRQYKVQAHVRLSYNNITDVQNGYVHTLDDNIQLCYFYGLNNLSVQFDSMATDRAAILAAIEEFEASLKAEELV